MIESPRRTTIPDVLIFPSSRSDGEADETEGEPESPPPLLSGEPPRMDFPALPPSTALPDGAGAAAESDAKQRTLAELRSRGLEGFYVDDIFERLDKALFPTEGGDVDVECKIPLVSGHTLQLFYALDSSSFFSLFLLFRNCSLW